MSLGLGVGFYGLAPDNSIYQSFTITDIGNRTEIWLKNNTGVTAGKWDDSSGNNNHVVQTNAANRATVDTGGGLDFEKDNSHHYDLTTKIDIADNQGFCIAMVLTRESNSSGGLLSDSANEMVQITNSETIRIKTKNASNETTITDAVFAAGTFDIGQKFVLLINRKEGVANQFTFFKNGTQLTADVDLSSNEAQGENPGGIEFTVLGNNGAAEANFFDGIIHEAVIYSKGLSVTEKADVNSYLTGIHGL